MARKSRKNANKQETVWAVSVRSLSGIYVRLSVEDNNCSTGDSIQNQTAYLKEFVESRGDEFQLVDIYTDNGTTGTNFDSMRKTFKNDMLMNSLTNIVNEYYARDISRKVTQARKAM